MLKAPNYKEHQPIRLSTYGIIFMGTPHLGSDGADIGQLALNVASIFMSTNTKVVKSLKKDSVLLKQLLDDYGKISGEFDTTFAYETVETKIFGKRQMVSILILIQSTYLQYSDCATGFGSCTWCEDNSHKSRSYSYGQVCLP